MAAGLGFKTFTTGEVLTAADTNGYLMQGVLVFASAAARDAAITSPQEGQCCYLKDTDAVLTYSGAAWVGFDDSNAIQNSIVNAKGDIIAASANDVPAILSVGAIDLLVTAASGEAAGLKYTGGWTTWTPSYTRFTPGNATISARYQKIGKTVNFVWHCTWGSTTSTSNFPLISFPIAPVLVTSYVYIGNTQFIDTSAGAYYFGGTQTDSTSGFTPFAQLANSTYLSQAVVDSATPVTWAVNDVWVINGSYEVA